MKLSVVKQGAVKLTGKFGQEVNAQIENGRISSWASRINSDDFFYKKVIRNEEILSSGTKRLISIVHLSRNGVPDTVKTVTVSKYTNGNKEVQMTRALVDEYWSKTSEMTGKMII